jgi:hypothetical protein
MPDCDWNSFSGKLWFNTSPSTVDRCVRILLSGLANVPYNRGRLNRHRLRRGPADGYQIHWPARCSSLRKPDPDLQYVRLVFVLCQLTHEPDAPRKA